MGLMRLREGFCLKLARCCEIIGDHVGPLGKGGASKVMPLQYLDRISNSNLLNAIELFISWIISKRQVEKWGGMS